MCSLIPAVPAPVAARQQRYSRRSQWQIVVDVNGCKMTGLEKNLSGDSLSYMAGPRWTPPVTGQLVPYFQVLFGGNKLTQELISPQQETYLTGLAKSIGSEPPDRTQYVQQFEHDGFAMAAGMGLDYTFNRALAFHVLSRWAYTRSGPERNLRWLCRPPQGFQFKTGVVLHMGNW